MQGVFYGIGAAVIAIIAQSARKLTRLTLRRDLFLWLIFDVSALVTAWMESEIFSLFVRLDSSRCSFGGWLALGALPPRSYRSRGGSSA